MIRRSCSVAVAALALGALAFAAPTRTLAGDHDHGHDHSGHDHAGHDHPAAIPAEVGKTAPGFTLTDTEGKSHDLGAYAGKVVVLEWFNPDCPFVKKHHAMHKTMSNLAGEYGEKGVVWLAINSGAPGKQGAGLERNQKARKEFGISYPVLLDESGEVGKAYGATNTPHMFVIDQKGTLVYAGAIDDNPSPDKLGETNYVKEAVSKCLGDGDLGKNQTKAYGCSVKYAS